MGDIFDEVVGATKNDIFDEITGKPEPQKPLDRAFAMPRVDVKPVSKWSAAPSYLDEGTLPRMVSEGGPSAIGATAGAVLGAAGGPPGMIAGGVLGGMGGELLRQAWRRGSKHGPQTNEQAVTEQLLAGAGGAIEGLGPAAKAAFPQAAANKALLRSREAVPTLSKEQTLARREGYYNTELGKLEGTLAREKEFSGDVAMHQRNIAEQSRAAAQASTRQMKRTARTATEEEVRKAEEALAAKAEKEASEAAEVFGTGDRVQLAKTAVGERNAASGALKKKADVQYDRVREFADSPENRDLEIDLTDVAEKMRPMYDRLAGDDTIPEAVRAASPGFRALKQVVEGEKKISLRAAMDNLSAIQDLGRTDIPSLRSKSQGIAATIIEPYRAAVDAGVRSMDTWGEEALAALNEGRRLTKLRHDVFDRGIARGVVRRLESGTDPATFINNPLVLESYIAQTKQKGVEALRRPVFDSLVKKAADADGNFNNALWSKAWNKLSPELKGRLFTAEQIEKGNKLAEKDFRIDQLVERGKQTLTGIHEAGEQTKTQLDVRARLASRTLEKRASARELIARREIKKFKQANPPPRVVEDERGKIRLSRTTKIAAASAAFSMLGTGAAFKYARVLRDFFNIGEK